MCSNLSLPSRSRSHPTGFHHSPLSHCLHETPRECVPPEHPSCHLLKCGRYFVIEDCSAMNGKNNGNNHPQQSCIGIETGDLQNGTSKEGSRQVQEGVISARTLRAAFHQRVFSTWNNVPADFVAAASSDGFFKRSRGQCLSRLKGVV